MEESFKCLNVFMVCFGGSDVLKVLNVKIMHYVFDMDIIYTLNMNIYKYINIPLRN